MRRDFWPCRFLLLACACADSTAVPGDGRESEPPPSVEDGGARSDESDADAVQRDADLPPEPGDDDCRVIDVAVSGGSGCALTAAGHVYCWGLDGNGELGPNEVPDTCVFHGPQQISVPCSLEPVRIPGISRAVGVSYGPSPCALGDDGRVRCWGSNEAGVLGASTATRCKAWFEPGSAEDNACSPEPVVVDDLEAAIELNAFGTTCARTEQDGVKCWGYHYPTATTVPGTESAIAAAQSCAVLEDGSVRCWGSAESGRLGTTEPIGTCSGPFNQPCTLDSVPVALEVDSVDVSSGWQHACAVSSEGELHCWGHNGYGQLGLGRSSEMCESGFPCEPLPQKVPELTGVARVYAGIGSTCVLTTDQRALCWGNLPIEGLAGAAPHAREVPLPGRVVTMSAERSGICFVLEDGSLYCAGLRYLEEDGVGVLSGAWKPTRLDVCGR
jgi:alpha-tubulin suppressor-like RCC1 family protein